MFSRKFICIILGESILRSSESRDLCLQLDVSACEMVLPWLLLLSDWSEQSLQKVI